MNVDSEKAIRTEPTSRTERRKEFSKVRMRD